MRTAPFLAVFAVLGSVAACSAPSGDDGPASDDAPSVLRPAREETGPWQLPWQTGTPLRVSQLSWGESHVGINAHAIDFSVCRSAPMSSAEYSQIEVRAPADGRIIRSSHRGGTCGTSAPVHNVVIIEHDVIRDGVKVQSAMMHLGNEDDAALLALDSASPEHPIPVRRGDVIGHVGNSGLESCLAAHLHLQFQIPRTFNGAPCVERDGRPAFYNCRTLPYADVTADGFSEAQGGLSLERCYVPAPAPGHARSKRST